MTTTRWTVDKDANGNPFIRTAESPLDVINPSELTTAHQIVREHNAHAAMASVLERWKGHAAVPMEELQAALRLAKEGT